MQKKIFCLFLDLNGRTATTFLGLQNCCCNCQIVNFLNTLGSRSWYKGGGHDIRSTDIETLSPCLNIGTNGSQYHYRVLISIQRKGFEFRALRSELLSKLSSWVSSRNEFSRVGTSSEKLEKLVPTLIFGKRQFPKLAKTKSSEKARTTRPNSKKVWKFRVGTSFWSILDPLCHFQSNRLDQIDPDQKWPFLVRFGLNSGLNNLKFDQEAISNQIDSIGLTRSDRSGPNWLPGRILSCLDLNSVQMGPKMLKY